MISRSSRPPPISTSRRWPGPASRSRRCTRAPRHTPGQFRKLDAAAVLTARLLPAPAALPRVPANPRVRDGELRGIHAVWADPDPGFVRTARQTRWCCPETGVPAGSFLPRRPMIRSRTARSRAPWRVSLRDRCATPDLPVRSQDRQLSGSGRKTGQAGAGSGRTSSTVRPALLKRGKPRSRGYRSY